ncbi:hypothetical protein, partial [Vibrio cholerae]|uniref:hypothetical protein n=1 Tax=Vibrio cholerae TaxID=666 RepID=UPI00301CF25A
LMWRRSGAAGSPPADALETDARHGLARLWWLTLSGIYLLVVCQGQHPTKGYWCYPGALMFLCAGAAPDSLLGNRQRRAEAAGSGELATRGR